MTKYEEIAKKIAQAIEKANSAYIFSSECDSITKILSELRDHFYDLGSQPAEIELDPILLQINNICNVFDSFKSDNWLHTILQTPIEDIISNTNETMKLLIESLEKIGIKLDKYTISINNLSNDLNIIYGKLVNPNEKSEVQNKLDEISQYLDKIGRPLLSSSERKKDDDLDKRYNFIGVKKYKLQKSDYTQSVLALTKKSNYIIFKGKMKLSKEDVTIMVLKSQSYDEEKFKRFVNVLTAVKHPNLESFVGAVESPLPFTVVTRRIGQELSTILKHELLRQTQDKIDEEEEEEENIEQITIKPGYRTIIAFKIASAMSYLHSLKIIHRDLCSNNIMIDNEFNPRITNFANSRMIPEDSLAMSCIPISPKEFKAPEITDSSGYNKEVDVFSFGGILYELLTNSAPFSDWKNPNIEDLLKSSVRPKLPKDISKDLKELIESCWDQDPNKRPSFVDIIDRMLSKSITFPQDKDAEVLKQFYGSKKIKNVDLQACFNLFKKIQIEINNSFVYKEEATRIRAFLHAYQYQLQNSKYSSQSEITEDDVLIQICNCRSALENLLSTLAQTEINTWKTIYLSTPALEIPNDLHQYMELIYISLHSIGLDVKKYDFVKSDLQWDLRFVYSIFQDQLQYNEKEASDRMKEIETFMKKNNFKLEVSQTEINQSVKDILSNWKDYTVDRSEFKLSIAQLGRGLSCRVHKATRKNSNKEYAVKVIHNSYLHDKDDFKLLRREIGILVRLNNDYLVKFVGFNADPGEPIWIVSEYMSGGNLSKSVKKLNPFQKTKIAFEVAQGMEFLRSKRVVHRDLKTANILLEGDIRSNNVKPRICDFGFAREDLSLIMSSKIGTTNYMAPEVIKGNCYDFKADVFSYGMILWELYSGQKPFENTRTNDEVFQKILDNEKLPYDKRISDDLKELIEDAKNIDPNKRPSFTDIINRMLNNKIAFSGANPVQIKKFYEDKAKERDINNK